MDISRIFLHYFDMFDRPWSVHIQTASRGYLSPDWAWDHAGGDTKAFLLWVLLGGEGRLRTPDGVVELRRGTVLLNPLRQPYRGRHNPHRPLHVPWLVFFFQDAGGEAFVPAPPPGRRFGVKDLGFLEDLVERAVDAHEGGPGQAEAASHWLKAALLELFREERAPVAGQPARERYERIQKLCRHIQGHPAMPLPVDAMAKQLHCTPDHFIRLFREVRGTTPGEFQIRCRINAAKQMLRFSNQPVGRIAAELGYRDVYFFSRQFRAKTGLTPTAYRRGEESSAP